MTAEDLSQRMAPEARAAVVRRAATRLFARRGYASTSVQDVVAAAGVTKPILYRHFASKQDLCIRLLEEARDELIGAALREMGPAEEAPQRRVARMIDGWVAWAVEHPDATRLLFTPIRGDEAVEAAQAALHARQRDTQAALIRELAPDLAPEAVEPLAHVTWAGFAAMGLWASEAPGRAPAARDALLRLTRGVLAR